MSRRPHSGKKTNLSQFGLLDIPDINDDDENLDLSDDDFDLEAELAAIAGGNQKHKPRKPPPVPIANFDAMVAESLKDVPSDDEEGSGDDDDPDLLNELQALTIDDDDAPSPPPRSTRPAPPPPGAPLSTDSSTISLLQDRITNYTVAEKNAKSNGESSRARRFNRGIKTLNDLLKQAKAGKTIKQEEIPPPVTVGKPADASQPAVPQREAPQPPPEAELPEMPLIDFGSPEPRPPEPSPPEPSPPEPSPPEPGLPGPSIVPSKAEESRRAELKIILDRKDEFKSAALAAKRGGNMTLALELLKVAKQFELVVDAHNNGQEMNLDELPTVAMVTREIEMGKTEKENIQNSEAPAEEPSGGGLITAKTLKEGLEQRLDAFRKQEAKATEEGNSSKARRMHRIVKQYTDAIKQHERGVPIAVDELPTPAGYGPLPQDGAGSSAAARSSPAAAPSPRQEQALALLLRRHKLFKDAALYCKKKGDIESAKKYLRGAKVYEPCIQAAQAGQPVDLTRLPKPPPSVADMDKLDLAKAKKKAERDSSEGSHQDFEDPEDSGSHDFTIVDATGESELDREPDEAIFATLKAQLKAQVTMSMENVVHHQKIGNIGEVKRFTKLHERAIEDLEVIKVARRTNKKVPNFHYVMREFSIVQCNTDLKDSDLELTIVRGIAYNVENPTEVDTYVKFEFPFPQEAPVSDRTSVVKNTNSPEYNAVFPLSIDRSRACLRVFKRHGVKLEVWSKGGWFRSDTLLGSVNVKLAPLQDKITLHESFPLADGRRSVGGNLEVKLRVRTPLLQPHIETSKHRWLMIDGDEMS